MISRSTDVRRALRERQRGFVLNPYSVQAPAPTGTAWNKAGATSNFGANPTFWLMSNSDRTMTSAAAANTNMCMRGTTAKTSGKWYFECVFTYTGTIGTSFDLGVISSAATMTNNYQTGSGKGDVTYRSNSQCFTDGVNTYNGTDGLGSWVSGDIFGFAIDVATNLKIYRNNALKFTITLATASVTPYLAFEGNPASGTLATTLNTSAAQCTYSPPAGYSNWD